MEYAKFLLTFLIFSPCPIFSESHGSQQKSFSDLRRYKIAGVGGRFIVNRDDLEQELQSRKQQDAACGQDVKLQLPQAFPQSSYNESYQGEVILDYVTITDQTLADELPICLKKQFETSFQIFRVSIPVFLGETEQHGLLFLRSFTNSTRKVPVPYSTSSSEVTHVDSIEEDDDGKVTLRLGDDVITIQVLNDDGAGREKGVFKNVDKGIGKVIPVTNYPMSFDWDCEYFGSEISFCQVLDEFRCDLASVGGDVCALISTVSSNRSSKTVKLLSITGIFQRMFPYLVKTVPSESFEAKIIDIEHMTGIRYPCLNL